MRRLFAVAAVCLLSIGCAANQKACASISNSNFGADWVVVQYAMDGRPFHCWKLTGAVVESHEGGNVDWLDTKSGHMVHLTGWENRVQVSRGDFAEAARIVGVDIAMCENGLYPATPSR